MALGGVGRGVGTWTGHIIVLSEAGVELRGTEAAGNLDPGTLVRMPREAAPGWAAWRAGAPGPAAL